MRLDKRFFPFFLMIFRAILGPVVVALSIFSPQLGMFGICLVLAFLSDVFDGVLARKLDVATPGLRRLDSAADTVFYLSALFAAWHLHPDFILGHIDSLAFLAFLEVFRYGYDVIKFGREASYHMWTSKLWGILLFAGFFEMLVFDSSGFAVDLAIYSGILADFEGLAISFLLKYWKNDVPTLFHAIRLRAEQFKGGYD